MGTWVVSDCAGFVGAFASVGAAESAVAAYATIPFAIQHFAAAPPAEGAGIWVVPYRDVDAVAFVSACEAEAERAKAALDRIGHTYPDPISCWQQPFGVVTAAALRRLDPIRKAHQLYSGPLSTDEIQAAELADLRRALEATGELEAVPFAAGEPAGAPPEAGLASYIVEAGDAPN